MHLQLLGSSLPQSLEDITRLKSEAFGHSKAFSNEPSLDASGRLQGTGAACWLGCWLLSEHTLKFFSRKSLALFK